MKKLLIGTLILINLVAWAAQARSITIDNIDNFPALKSFYNQVDYEPQPKTIKWNKKGAELLKEVNLYYNKKILYENHTGKANYYQTPKQTMDLGRGNCEDYATAKWWALVNNGVDQHIMYFYSGIHQDYKINHTVLAVFLNNRFYYLDNTTEDMDKTTIESDASWMANRYGVTIFVNDIK